tara:strand:+ start:2528 stop:3031 length:504 start_codon:yes stop_codon:yes gene_type:complete
MISDYDETYGYAGFEYRELSFQLQKFIPFESWAEKEAYPIIHTLCIEELMDFEYKVNFGIGLNSRKKFTEYHSKHDSNGYRSWSFDVNIGDQCPKYRVDFRVTNGKNKLIIEIDGDKHHKNQSLQDRRDLYFQNVQNTDVLHIPASKSSNSVFIKSEIMTYFTNHKL